MVPSGTRATSFCAVTMSKRKASDSVDDDGPKVKTGDAFPMEPHVQHGWLKATTLGDLFKDCSKVLVVTLPGAFTPT